MTNSLSSPKRILLIDDNVDATAMLAMVIDLLGHVVRVANDGPSGLSLASELIPDIVFLDIGMPRMNGYVVARHMRQIPGLNNLILVALTGWNDEATRRCVMEAGFNHHLVKPAETSTIRAIIGCPEVPTA